MNYIKDYDSLAYIDNEYDNPIVKEVVHNMITEEMKLIKPKNYLGIYI